MNNSPELIQTSPVHAPGPTVGSPLARWLAAESTPGVIMFCAAVLGLVAANSASLAPLYDRLLSTTLTVQAGEAGLSKPLLLWVNDGLMAVFFLLVGLELKREVLAGSLSDARRAALPALGAVGGMLVPALVYAAFNHGDGTAMRGWAIPAATDIAFALAVLALLGERVPAALKVFLLSLAILDDLGAILVIALFYTADLSTASLLVAASAIAVLAALNGAGVRRMTPYVLVGLVLWTAVLKSGVHATLAGVLLAAFIPLREAARVEHGLHPWVYFAVLPLFAFANAGVSLAGLTPAALLAPIPLGIALGLLLGKQVGIVGFCWLAVKLRLARLPAGVSWPALHGVAVLCGIGFTMSLFIASLAFEATGANMVEDRLGILVGSTLSALLGYLLLRAVLPPRAALAAT